MINKNRLVADFLNLVSIDSPSFAEQDLSAYVQRQLVSFGFTVVTDDAGEKIGGNCGNVYGFLIGEAEGTPLLFCAHMDTVEPAINKKAVVDPDGIIHTDGSTVLGADDFAGIAILLEAIRSLKESGVPHRSIEVLFTVAEEAYGRGAKVFDFAQIHAKEAYVLDYNGAVGSAVYAAPTILPFTLEITGKSAHAGFAPETGIHAIAVAANALSKLQMGRIDEDTTVNFGLIQGGTATNIVPDHCILRGEIRSYSHHRALEMWEHIQHIFERSAEERGAILHKDGEYAVHAYETPLDAPVATRFKRACSDLELTPHLTRTFGGSDNNVFAQHGIEGLVLACSMYNCHTCGEYTVIEELCKTCELVVELIIRN